MQFSTLEISGVIIAIATLCLDIQENVWARPLSIIGATMAIFVYYPAGLYATCMRKCAYIVLDTYGWYKWMYGGANNTPLPVSRTSAREMLILALSGLLVTGIVGKLLVLYTEPSLPYLDSLHMTFAVIAQGMIVNKKLESWMLWLSLNVMFIFMCYYKGLYLFSALHVFYIFLAVRGHRAWYRSYQASKAA